MLPVACTVTGAWCGEAPSVGALPVTHRELKGQGSDLLSQASNKQAGGSVSHTSSGTCLVIVSLSPTTFRRQQQADKQIERLFDAGALFSCDTPTPILLRSLGGGGSATGRDACSDCEV